MTNETLPVYVNVTNLNATTIPPPIPPTPWYIYIIPELVLTAGIVATALTFYFSPGLRNSFRTFFNRLRK
ncbi:hypothetical protein DFR87_06230 [Metallosphaera hakonensis JCM 8857 = DSM 7519]|uniref:Uncharacterized protein n=1 Tax=Metallosphaera hakonensis JCM 8857 = DSM 7519 TaxID=1293036 RepID=A0A2U9IWW1_9CREN|nr:hypothetical protein DFR87_06230 [Metallosphaera hakonensis JCM 8857 = DSM 7519]